MVSIRGIELEENNKRHYKDTRYLSGLYIPCGGDLMFKLKLSRSFNYDAIGMYLAYKVSVF